MHAIGLRGSLEADGGRPGWFIRVPLEPPLRLHVFHFLFLGARCVTDCLFSAGNALDDPGCAEVRDKIEHLMCGVETGRQASDCAASTTYAHLEAAQNVAPACRRMTL